jgi:hypothetical protein
MFDLSLKEVFFTVREVRKDQKFLLKHVFRPPTLEDWVDYHKGTSQLGLSKGRDTIEMSNVRQERDEWLWDLLIVRVEGYIWKGKPITESKDWKAKIPLSHKLEAVSGFLLSGREDVPEEDALIESTEGFDLAEGVIEMKFAIFQNGKTERVGFLFNSPESKDYLRFSRMSSKMQLQRTKQRNVSAIRVPTDISPFVELFDKLIQKVEGYVFEGKDVMEATDWKDKIDALHKRMAVQEVFTASLQEEEVGKFSGD